MSVVVRDASGNVLAGRSIAWSVDDASAATVSVAGLVAARAIRTVQVIATSEGKSDTATLSLVPVVALRRLLPSLFVGDTTLLTVSFTDSLGGTLFPTDTTWMSGDTSIAVVSGAGIVSGVRTGQAAVTAAGGGANATEAVVVLPHAGGEARDILWTRNYGRSDGARPDALWAVNPEDTTRVRVSTDSEFVYGFDRSPDGAHFVITYANYAGIGRNTSVVTDQAGHEQADLHVSALTPRWGPDNDMIAFAIVIGGKSEIEVIRQDGSGLRRLTFDGDNDSPVWSPDGRQVAFIHRGVNDAIGFVRPDATGRRTVSVGPGKFGKVRWSPDGKLLAFIDLAGAVLVAFGDGASPRTVCAAADGCGVGNLEWAPDATELVVDVPNLLHILNLQGAKVTTVPTAPSCCGNYHGGPVWAPDGARIAYTAVPDTGLPVGRVWVVDRDGTNARPLTPADSTNPTAVLWRW